MSYEYESSSRCSCGGLMLKNQFECDMCACLKKPKDRAQFVNYFSHVNSDILRNNLNEPYPCRVCAHRETMVGEMPCAECWYTPADVSPQKDHQSCGKTPAPPPAWRHAYEGVELAGEYRVAMCDELWWREGTSEVRGCTTHGTATFCKHHILRKLEHLPRKHGSTFREVLDAWRADKDNLQFRGYTWAWIQMPFLNLAHEPILHEMWLQDKLRLRAADVACECGTCIPCIKAKDKALRLRATEEPEAVTPDMVFGPEVHVGMTAAECERLCGVHGALEFHYDHCGWSTARKCLEFDIECWRAGRYRKHVEEPEATGPSGCKCQTLSQCLTGDGCDICNPEMAAEIEAENAAESSGNTGQLPAPSYNAGECVAAFRLTLDHLSETIAAARAILDSTPCGTAKGASHESGEGADA